MSEHTPEPWEWVFAEEDPDQRVLMNASGSNVLKAWATYQDSHAGIEVGEADACLIAAAPELLAVLEAVLAQVGSTHPSTWEFLTGVRSGYELYDLARAAVAKARGVVDTGITSN